jgi:hypothetical protein
VIAEHPATAGLRYLWAHTTGITDKGIKAIVESPHLANLLEATFGSNSLGAAGGKHLLEWKSLAHMRSLTLFDTKLPKATVSKLAKQWGDRVRF